jgi:hypothetical protein
LLLKNDFVGKDSIFLWDIQPHPNPLPRRGGSFTLAGCICASFRLYL